jgi:hypothetical protein
MIQDKQTITIAASPEAIWSRITDLEQAYSYEHEKVQITSDDKSFKDGMRFQEKERIGGILAEVDAEIFDVVPNQQYQFKGKAIYHYLGMKIPIEEGGKFSIESAGDQSTLSLEAWGYFPDNLYGKIIEFVAKHILNIPKSLARHNLGELNEFKQALELS